jgi:hypothetical protein
MQVPFDAGCIQDLSYPHFALYQPVNDCFMLTVDCDADRAREIKLLASARYSLFVVDLKTANNYDLNLIDNTCCHDWTLSNRSDVGVGSADKPQIIAARSLLNIPAMEPDLQYEKQYLQTVWHCIKYLESVENRTNKFIHDWMDGVLDLDFHDPEHHETKNLIKKIKKTLYLGTDLEQMHLEIQQLQSQLEKLLPTLL